MKNKDFTSFDQSRRLAAFLSKEYSKDFITLLVMYKDISASEAASRLNLHIKTTQDFLEGLEKAGILSRREASEGKRPYFRYTLKEKTIHITFDLEGLYNRQAHVSGAVWMIKERNNSGALFKEGRGERISAIHVFEGSGRSREEQRYSLTECQGRFLFHLPFPTEPPSPVMDIMHKANLGEDCLPEIMDLVDILLEKKVIKKT